MSNEPPDAISALIAKYVAADGSVKIPPRAAHWLKVRLGRLLDNRINLRDRDPEVYAVLAALRLSAIGYRTGAFAASVTGTNSSSVHHDSLEWVTTVEASRAFGVTDRCVRNWIAAGRLPARRHAGRWLIERHHLDTVKALA